MVALGSHGVMVRLGDGSMVGFGDGNVVRLGGGGNFVSTFRLLQLRSQY